MHRCMATILTESVRTVTMVVRVTGSWHMDEEYVCCDECDGTGTEEVLQSCSVCGGSGEVEVIPDEGHSHECDTGACYC